MPTTLANTGITFPNATTQTTSYESLKPFAIGIDQTWNVLLPRNLGVTYYNNTAKPIYVSVSVQSTLGGNLTVVNLIVDGKTLQSFYHTPDGGRQGIFSIGAIVPPGGTSYSVTATNGTVYAWAELR